MNLAATVIVRTKDSAATLESALRSVREQTVDIEIVVVDSGSTDATLDIAADMADRVEHFPAADFSYGGALNRGAAVAEAEVHVALSSHCALPRPDWVELAVAHMIRGAVGAVGAPAGPDGRPLEVSVDADHATLLANRHWGFSNHASAWSARMWERHQFREDLPASEDKEWSWRATEDGAWITIDPLLLVPSYHRRSAGVRAYHRRLVREWTALAPGHRLPPYPLLQAALDWTRRHPLEPRFSSAPRFGRTRMVEVVARRSAGRERPGR